MFVVKFAEGTARVSGYEGPGPGGRQRWYRSKGLDKPSAASRVFVSVTGENLGDNLCNRMTRPYKAWKPLVEDALRAEGVGFEKLRWSQKAGCTMCPCSPGFIIDGETGKDYWVTIDASEPQTTDLAVSNARREQLGI